ncbi:MAG: hypothetical protein ACAI44_26450 [Candidatus Sericytochromatia bacterium]
MRAETLLLIGTSGILGLHTLAVVYDCLRCWRAIPLLQRHAWRLKSLRHLNTMDEASLPPLTLLLPLRNQVDEAVSLIRRMMALKYPKVEYLIINDGSDDKTLHLLQEQLGLHPVPRFPVAELNSMPVRGVYQSEDSPRLWVIDKEAGGPADAINAGLNFCQTPLVGMLSARIQPLPDALIQATRPFLEQANTWAVCGRIRPSAGARPRLLATTRWGRIQTLLTQRDELLDAVLDSQASRYARLSPDLTLFRRTSLVEAGGFSRTSSDYFADMAVRLYRVAKIQGDQMQLVFVPDTLGWRQGAENAAELKQYFEQEQDRSRLLIQAGSNLPGRRGILFRQRWLPLLNLLTWLSAVPLAVLAPLWLPVWLLILLAPASIWQLVLMLGERTDHRFSFDEVKKLQQEAWVLPLLGLPLLSIWQLRNGMKSPPPPASPTAGSTRPLQTSPLKPVAK